MHTKHRFKRKSESLLKDLTKNLVLKSDVSGKPLRNEGNENCIIAQNKWKQYTDYMIVFIGFKKGTALWFEMCVGWRRINRYIETNTGIEKGCVKAVSRIYKEHCNN